MSGIAGQDDDQRLLADSARRYLERSYPFESRAKALAEPLGFSSQRWAEFAELGWLGVGLSESSGGFGGPREQLALAQEFGRALVVEPWLEQSALMAPLLEGLAVAGDPTDREVSTVAQSLVAALLAGQTMVSLAAFEVQGRYDAFDVCASAQRQGEGWLIDGHKTLVFAGTAARHFLVLARVLGGQRDPDGLALFLVAADAAGLSCRGLPTYDGRQTSDLHMTGVRLPASAMLAGPGQAWPLVERALDHATVMACGEAVGTMELAHELTREYLRSRKQFGRLLTENQVIRHRLVDLYVATEQARAITTAAADRLNETPAARQRAVSLAKAFVSPAGRRVGEDAVQLHGAIGMTDDYRVGHCYKRLAATANLFGDEQWHLDRLTRLDNPTGF